VGGAGSDTLEGGFGDDTIDGGKGRDTIDGGAGDDTLKGGPGNDTLEGGSGDDTVDGGDGKDRIEGGFGDDILMGGPGREAPQGVVSISTMRAENVTDFAWQLACLLMGGVGRYGINPKCSRSHPPEQLNAACQHLRRVRLAIRKTSPSPARLLTRSLRE